MYLKLKTILSFHIRILILLFVGVLMGALDISTVGPAIPAIESTMLLTGTDVSWIFSIYVLFYLFGLPTLTALISVGLGLYQSSIVFLPKLSVELFDVTPSEASFMLLPLVISTAVVPPVSGWLLDKIGSRIIVFTGLVFTVVSLFLFSLLSNNIVLFYAAMVGLGIGLAIRASLKYIVLGGTGKLNRAASLGMLTIIISIGQLTGAALIGAIISGPAEITKGFGHAFMVLAFISAGLVLLSVFLKNQKEEF